MKKAAAFTMFLAILFCAAEAPPAGAGGPVPVIHSAGPIHQWHGPYGELKQGLSLGSVVRITGTGFGYSLGPGRVLNLERVLGGRVGNFTPSESPHRIPILDWHPTRILVLLTSSPQLVGDEYHLVIRDASSGDWRRLSNEFPVTVVPGSGVAPLPAREALKPYLRLIHPELARSGGDLDLYGDFPFPDPSLDKVILAPAGLLLADGIPSQALRPVEISKPHVHARLPNDLPAGEYSVRVGRDEHFRSNGRRVIVRSTEPAPWEYNSELTQGFGPVPYRIVAALSNVGVEARCVDVLGIHFGPNRVHQSVVLGTRLDVQHADWNIQNRLGHRVVHPIPAPRPIVFWSDTRIRIDAGEPLAADPRYVYIEQERGIYWGCSNAVRVVTPGP